MGSASQRFFVRTAIKPYMSHGLNSLIMRGYIKGLHVIPVNGLLGFMQGVRTMAHITPDVQMESLSHPSAGRKLSVQHSLLQAANKEVRKSKSPNRGLEEHQAFLDRFASC